MLFGLEYINNRGDSLRFGGGSVRFRDTIADVQSPYDDSNPYSLIKFEGFGEVDASVQTQKSPFQDGSTHIDTVLNERFPYIEFVIRANHYEHLSAFRRHVSRVLNPKIDGRFELTFGNETFVIEAIPEHVPFFPDEGSDAIGTVQTVSVNFICPNPYWQSTEQTTEPLAAFIPTFTFPFTFPVKFGERGSQVTLVNDGDVPAPIEIEFNGPATNPEVRNLTTGEFIRVRRELKDGEKLIINTSEGRDRKVIIDRGNGVIENAWGYIDIWESTLLHLDVGENVISYDALASGGQALVNISFRKRYVGV